MSIVQCVYSERINVDKESASLYSVNSILHKNGIVMCVLCNVYHVLWKDQCERGKETAQQVIETKPSRKLLQGFRWASYNLLYSEYSGKKKERKRLVNGPKLDD